MISVGTGCGGTYCRFYVNAYSVLSFKADVCWKLFCVFGHRSTALAFFLLWLMHVLVSALVRFFYFLFFVLTSVFALDFSDFCFDICFSFLNMLTPFYTANFIQLLEKCNVPPTKGVQC